MKQQDSFQNLNEKISLNNKLRIIHDEIKSRMEFINRISVALYDAKTGMIRTFLASSGRDYPIDWYEMPIEDAPSLMQIMINRSPRILNNLDVLHGSKTTHSENIVGQGYRSSCTAPILWNGIFLGFIFYDSYVGEAFDEKVMNDLKVYSQLISALIAAEITTIRTFTAALLASYKLIHSAEPQAPDRAERVSQIARFLARCLAESQKVDLTEEEVERIGWFAALYDIGKITIPEAILATPLTLLSPAEAEILKSHTLRGIQLIDLYLKIYKADPLMDADKLRNIIQYHQDYPEDFQNLPVEARIVALADLLERLAFSDTGEIRMSAYESLQVLKWVRTIEIGKDLLDPLEEHLYELQQLQSRLATSLRKNWDMLAHADIRA